jgi:hypothetical protein
MIFMWFLARSSRGTGPKIRVPIGSFLLFDQHSRIAVEPDHAAIGTANVLGGAHDDGLHHVALLDAAARNGLLDETTMMSPTEAYLRLEPPSTLMHMTRRAPELSATSRFVCI